MADWRNISVRTILITGLVVASLLVAGIALMLSTYIGDPALTVTDVTVHPDAGIHVGTPVRCTFTVEAPWYRWPLEPAAVALPGGVQVVERRSPRLAGLGPGTWRWDLSVVIQPLTLGTKEDLELTARFTADRGGNAEPLPAALPDIEVTPRFEENDAPAIALAPPVEGRLTKGPRSWRGWLALGILIFVILVIVVSILRHRDAEPYQRHVPPGETARSALRRLADDMPLPAEAFFVRLTDILRTYIEQRFSLPATEQTTPEFLSTVKDGKDLSPDRQAALTECLTAADQVKFARGEATEEQMQAALEEAQRFIVETQAPAAAGQDADDRGADTNASPSSQTSSAPLPEPARRKEKP